MSAILIHSASSELSSGLKDKPKKIKVKEKEVKKIRDNEVNSGLKEKPKKIIVKEKDVERKKDKEIKTDSIDESTGEVEDEEDAREERKATGRSVAIVIFLALMCLALYHVIQKRTTILAGVSCAMGFLCVACLCDLSMKALKI